MTIYDRTAKALGEDVMSQLRSLRFCIVGCGGTGASFAEMLVRSGAIRLSLIDGTDVDESNLNRVFCFYACDVGQPKVEVLARRLKGACKDLEILPLRDSFKEAADILPGHLIGQRVRDAVHDADVVFIATDTNKSRRAIEKLCRDELDRRFLSCGVHVDQDAGVYKFECSWLPATPVERENAEGYGPDNASYISIVQEATSVAFSMLLSHLKSPNSDFRSYYRRYDANLRPVETRVNGKSNGSTL